MNQEKTCSENIPNEDCDMRVRGLEKMAYLQEAPPFSNIPTKPSNDD